MGCWSHSQKCPSTPHHSCSDLSVSSFLCSSHLFLHDGLARHPYLISVQKLPVVATNRMTLKGFIVLIRAEGKHFFFFSKSLSFSCCQSPDLTPNGSLIHLILHGRPLVSQLSLAMPISPLSSCT